MLLALALGLAPSLASAEVFRWVDELGVTHYTTDRGTIPRRFRGDAQPLEASPAARAAPSANPAPTAATPPLPLPDAPAPTAPAPTATVPSAAVPGASERPAPELAPSSAPVFPGPATTPSISPEDPRAAEVADLEARIAADREQLRQMISTKRWDSAELASDPSIREIAERLPRLQAELAALRAETVP